ncbi:MAG: hypothetical protein ACPGU7_14795 [Gammaproteobacteria bacterium]
MTERTRIVLVLLLILGAYGCEAQSIRQLAYETLESKRLDDCRRLQKECPERVRFEDYERARESGGGN